MRKKLIFAFLFACIILFIICKSISNYNSRKPISNNSFKFIIRDYQFSMIKSNEAGFVDCVAPQGAFRIETDPNGENLRYVVEPSHGKYIYLCDDNCDGFPDFGVLKDTGKRVKFSFSEMAFTK